MRISLVLAPLLIAACTPLGLYYKAGARVDRAQRELRDCRVMAAGKVPPHPVTVVIPGPLFPPRRVCDASGNCYVIPGHRLPPDIVTEDANAGLRREVVAQCMGDRGYTYVRIPACSPAIQNAVTPKQTVVIPRLQENSCVVRGQGGTWQIVTPG